MTTEIQCAIDGHLCSRPRCVAMSGNVEKTILPCELAAAGVAKEMDGKNIVHFALGTTPTNAELRTMSDPVAEELGVDKEMFAERILQYRQGKKKSPFG